MPTVSPTLAPTVSPTIMTASPTQTPTITPTLTPTALPTLIPTAGPTVTTPAPTVGTQTPTITTSAPTVGTATPSTLNIPTTMPTIEPSVSPSNGSFVPFSGFSQSPSFTNGAISVRIPESVLAYGFFTGAPVREPTAEELAGILEQQTLFFEEILTLAFPNFIGFVHDGVTTTFDPDPQNLYPVSIDFDAVANFSPDSIAPTIDEVFQAMNSANYNDYIQRFAWSAAPPMESLFFETQRVAFDASVEQQ